MNGFTKTVPIALVLLLVLAPILSVSASSSEEKEVVQDDAAPAAQTSRSPIRIDKDSDFTTANGVVGGSGTKANPYIIADWSISGLNAGCCIYIGNNTKHFVIRNCTLKFADGVVSKQYYYASGLVLYNATNGTVHNTTSAQNLRHGMYLLEGTNNITLYDVEASSNSNHQICLQNKVNYTTLSNSTFKSSTGNAAGICIYNNCNNNTVMNVESTNHGSGNGDHGLYVYNSQGINVSGLFTEYCYYGLYLHTVKNSVFENLIINQSYYAGAYCYPNNRYIRLTNSSFYSSANYEIYLHNSNNIHMNHLLINPGGDSFICLIMQTCSNVDYFNVTIPGGYNSRPFEFSQSPYFRAWNVNSTARNMPWMWQNDYFELIDSTLAYGFWLEQSSYCKIINVTLYTSNGEGIYLWMCPDSIVDKVDINTYYTPLYIESSGNLVMTNSRFRSVRGTAILAYSSDYMAWNNITIYDSGDGNGDEGTYLVYCDYSTFENMNITGSARNGIYARRCTNNDFSNITSSNNGDHGIYIYDSTHTNTIFNMTAIENQNSGFIIYGGSSSIENCTAIGNWDTGVHMRDGADCWVRNTTAIDNLDYGFYYYNSDRMNMTNCTSIGNGYHGLYHANSDWGTLTNNTIHDNEWAGIYLHYSSGTTSYNYICNNSVIDNKGPGCYVNNTGTGNEIHHNLFVRNNGGKVQGYDDGTLNRWDNGTEGNYWFDYPGRYPFATNDSHVWDTPYEMLGYLGNGQDNYPLADRWDGGGHQSGPIRINSDSDFTYANGVSNPSAAGTPANPYVIENHIIDGTGYGYCIYIGNTTKYFVVRDCTLYNARGNGATYYWDSGIVLYNVDQGSIQDNEIYSCIGDGILMDDADNVHVSGNIIRDVVGSGIPMKSSSNCNITLNDVRNAKGVEISSKDLEGYWNMDEEKWYDPYSVVWDQSGKENHGYLRGPTMRNGPGQSDKGGYFDGVDDKIDTKARPSSTIRTVSAWINPDRTHYGGTNFAPIVDQWGGGGAGNAAFTLGLSANQLQYSTYNAVVTTTASAPYTYDGKWHHVSAVQSGTTVYLYIDGSLASTTGGMSVPQVSTNYNVVFGYTNVPGAVSRYYQGWVDEVMIYSRPLTQKELYDQYHSQKAAVSLKSSPSNLVDNNTIADNECAGVFVDSSITNKINDNLITANGGAGLTIYKSDDVEVISNNISSNQKDNIDVTNGLVVHWKCDEPQWSGTSGEVRDYSGNNYHGTAASGADIIYDPERGWVGDLDGTTSGYIYVNPVAGFPNLKITCSYWMKTTDTTKYGTAVGYAGSSSTTNDFLMYDYRNIAPHLQGTSYSTGVSANDGSWHLITFTWDSATGDANLYKDGVLAKNYNQKKGSSFTSGGFLLFGQDQDSYGGNFDANQAFLGQFDDVRIYNRVLTPQEVYVLYNYTSSGVSLYQSNDALIEKNLINGNAGPGVLVYSCDGTFVRNNEVLGNGDSGVVLRSSPNTTVTWNNISDNYHAQAPLDGLVGYWNFEDETWDGTADEVKDLSGKKHHGYAYGATRTPSPWGQAASFDGNDRINFKPDQSPLVGYSNFTLSLYVKSTYTADMQLLQQRESNVGQFDFQMQGNGTIYYNDYWSGYGFAFFGDTSINDGKWHQVALVRERNFASIFIDGILDKKAYSANPEKYILPERDLAIGYDIGSNSQYFHGDMDEVRIYGRPLGESEIRDLCDTEITAGLLIQSSESTTVTDNTFSGNNWYGLRPLNSFNLDISDNLFARNLVSGLYINDLDEFTIGDNTFDSNVVTGAHFSNCLNLTVQDNIFLGGGGGILLDNCENSVFKRNNVSSTGSELNINDGLMAYYDFNTPAFADTDGLLVDMSGNDRHGILGYDSAVNATGVFGTAGWFDGSQDMVELPDMPLEDLTISVWVKPDKLIGEQHILSRRLGNSVPGNYQLQIKNDKVQFSRTLSASWAGYLSQSTIETGQWTNIVVTVHSGILKIFINGDLDASYSIGGLDTYGDQSTSIGDGRAGGIDLDGCLDELKIYDRGLTIFEVNSLFRQESPLQTLPAGIHLSECHGSDVNNNSFYRNGNTGLYVRGSDNGNLKDNSFNQNLAESITISNTTQCRVLDNDITSTRSPLDIGLCGYWKFDETSWDSTKADVTDSSGNGKHGTASKNYTAVEGKYGNAISFTNDGWVSIPNSTFDTVREEVTIGLWIYGNATAQPRNQDTFEGWDKVDRVINAHLPWGNGRVYWDAGGGGSFDRIEKDAATADYEGQWNHWVFTKNINTGYMRIYLNGVQWHSGGGKFKPITAMEKFYIGARPLGDYMYNGFIDEFMVYDRELSAPEISQIYEQTRPTHPGMLVLDSGGALVSGNSILSGVGEGIVLRNITDSRLTGNDISANELSGLVMENSDLNMIDNNTIDGNSYYSKDLNDSLVSHWAFDESSYTGAAGEVKDSQGTHHGTTFNLPTVTTGKHGNAALFDGINDYMSVPWDPELSITGDITLMAWVKTTESVNYQYLIGARGGASNGQYLFSLSADGYPTFDRYTPSGGSATSSISVNDGKWHHVAAVLYEDDDRVHFYVDGVEEIIPYYEEYTGGAPVGLYLGWDGYSGGAGFDGAIDGLMLFNKALSKGSVRSIFFNGGVSGVDCVESSGNNFLENVFDTNQGFALAFSNRSDDNTVHHNDFIYNNLGNGTQTLDDGADNVWDNGVDHGNFWTDWLDPDTDRNGIVDVPYVINGSSSPQDNYPICPYITIPGNLTPAEDILYSKSVVFTTTHTAGTWTFKTNATWLATNPNTGLISGIPQNQHVGVYYVDATISDQYCTKNVNFTLTVTNVNDGPVILTPDITDATEELYYENDYDAVDLDPTGDTFTWSFATDAAWLNFNLTNGLLNGTPQNSDVGDYWVNIRAVDNHGDFGETNFTLTVHDVNDPPWITTSDIHLSIEDTYFFNDYDASDMDPGPDVLTWSLDTNATFLNINSATGLLNGTPGNSDVGSYWVLVTVSDGRGGMDSTNFTLHVVNVNDDPVITTTDINTTLEDDPLSVQYSAYDIDPSMDTLTWSFASNAPFLGFNPTMSTLSGTPANAHVGSYWVNITVMDGKGGMDFTNFSLLVVNVNDPPLIESEPPVSCYEDEYFEFDFDAVDIDPTNDKITWSLHTNSKFLDIDEATGLINGTPDNSDVGKWWVNVEAKDNHGASDVINFSFEVLNTNDPPVWASVPNKNYEIEIQTPFDFDVIATDVDAGDRITYSVSTSPESLITIDATTGKLSWVAQDLKLYTISLIASDGQATIAYVFQIKVVEQNSAPVVTLTAPGRGSTIDTTEPILEWAGFDSDEDIISYDVYLGIDSKAVTEHNETALLEPGVTTEFFETSELVPGSTYYWTVVPKDPKCLGLCTSGVWFFTVAEDATEGNLPPTVNITSPVEGDQVSGVVIIEAQVDDPNEDDAISKVVFYYQSEKGDELLIAEVTSILNNKASTTWDTSNSDITPNGEYTIIARAWDSQNLKSQEDDSITITIHNKATEESNIDWWELMGIMIGILITVIVGIFGVVIARRRLTRFTRVLEEIDNIYEKNKHKPKVCEKLLVSKREELRTQVKGGSISREDFLVANGNIKEHIRALHGGKLDDDGKHKGKAKKISEPEIVDAEIVEPTSGKGLFVSKHGKTALEPPPLDQPNYKVEISGWNLEGDGAIDGGDGEVPTYDEDSDLMDDLGDPYKIEIPNPDLITKLALPPATVIDDQVDELPTIDEIFIMTQAGILLSHFRYKDTSIADEDLLASMLTVIQNFIKDSFGKESTALNKLELGDFSVLIMQGEHLSAVAISRDEDMAPLKKALKKMVKHIEVENREVLDDWDGDQDEVQGMEAAVRKLMDGGY